MSKNSDNVMIIKDKPYLCNERDNNQNYKYYKHLFPNDVQFSCTNLIRYKLNYLYIYVCNNWKKKPRPT